jgi:hypothetical protein
MRDTRRITLVVRGAKAPRRSWNISAEAANRIIFVDTFSMLGYALDHGSEDVDRLLIDGAGTAEDFLELLSNLPSAFPGDVLFSRPGATSYLSTTARADGRMLYALKEIDLAFYLETHGLIARTAKTGPVEANVECSMLNVE